MNPAEYNIEIWKGRDWYRGITITTPETGNPVDLSSHTILAQIRTRQRRDSTLIAEFTITPVDLANGQFKISIDDTTTGAIDYNSGFWDMLIVNPDGTDDQCMYGTVTFKGSVTAKP